MIADAYTVQFLVDGTCAQVPSIIWKERPSDSAVYFTQIGDVDIFLSEVAARPAARIQLHFRCGVEEFSLYSPLPTGLWGKKYATAAVQDTAERLQQLLQAAARQCAQRRAYVRDHEDEIRERLYRRVLFGQPTSKLAAELQER